MAEAFASPIGILEDNQPASARLRIRGGGHG